MEKTVLIVDDSPLQAIILRRILTHAQFTVLIAKDGNEALNYVLKNPQIDLIISDVNMPNMNGYELCRRLKEDQAHWHIPIILCTVLSSPEDLIRGIEVGAESYVTRPYHEENLLQLIQELLAMPAQTHNQDKEEIRFEGQTYAINATRQHLLNFLLSTYRNILQQNKELINLREELQKAYTKLTTVQKEQEQLLLNMLPESVANELIAYGSAQPARYEQTSVMFIDFVGFSKSAAILSPQDLIQALESYFDQFDQIIENFHLEKIKTMGDGYMCAAGVPTPNSNHAYQCVAASLEIQKLIKASFDCMKENYGVEWNARIGIHSGPIVAGVIGKKHIAYDIWGDTVNIASRMESHGITGEVNISRATYELVKNDFVIEPRGNLPIHNKGGIERYLEMFLVKDVIKK